MITEVTYLITYLDENLVEQTQELIFTPEELVDSGSDETENVAYEGRRTPLLASIPRLYAELGRAVISMERIEPTSPNRVRATLVTQGSISFGINPSP